MQTKKQANLATHYILPKIELVLAAPEYVWLICVHYHSLGVKKNRVAHEHCDWGWKVE